mmetsp:Transcript_41760/g.135058  ORF Transcript_41760/g.135058 Transcript_41760/m.135058 type:complete len:462 (-) Transcript_41760:59-1444(-)
MRGTQHVGAMAWRGNRGRRTGTARAIPVLLVTAALAAAAVLASSEREIWPGLAWSLRPAVSAQPTNSPAADLFDGERGLLSRRLGLLRGFSVAAASVSAPAPALAMSRSAEERQAASIFRDATPAVVSLARGLRPGERRPRQSADESGLPVPVGSGFLWDTRHVVTNYHVVKGISNNELMLILSDSGASSDAEAPQRDVVRGELLGADPATDIAVVRLVDVEVGKDSLKRMRAKPLPHGDSILLEVGQTVFAIGNPFGLEHSMSKGIVSGIARTLDIGERPIRGCIQTDASINPGNSGGPLLDSQGNVVGVNTAILSGTGTFSGVGLAIPISTVTRTVEAIIKQGFVRRVFLGITAAPDEVSEALQVPGVIVMAVVPGSPAELAGVKAMRKGSLGDVVTAIDGETVRAGKDFFRLLDKKAPGDVVEVRVQRALRGVDEGVEELTFKAELTAKDGFKPVDAR